MAVARNGCDGTGAADFENLDMDVLFAAATAPRNTDGSLPTIGLRLAAGSHLIDAGGANVGLPYLGAAPDLGAFEFPIAVAPASAEPR